MTSAGWKPAPGFIPPYPLAGDGVFLVDANCDNHPDLIYHRRTSSGNQELAFLWTPNGWATTSTQKYQFPFPPPINPAAIKLVHFNGDQYADVAVSEEGGANNGICLADPAGWRLNQGPSVIPPIPFVFSNGDDASSRFAISVSTIMDLVCNTVRDGMPDLAEAWINDGGHSWIKAVNMAPTYPLAKNNKALTVWTGSFRATKRTDFAYHDPAIVPRAPGYVSIMNQVDGIFRLTLPRPKR